MNIKPFKILIAEDHELFRISLEIALKQDPLIEVIGTAENGLKCKELFLSLKPDLILMDIGMPIINGLELVEFIKSKSSETKIIMLTAHDDEISVLAALRFNADAYCTKDISLNKLTEIIPLVMDGALYLDPLIAKYLYKAVNNSNNLHNSPRDSISTNLQGNISKAALTENAVQLSSRELEVLKLITEGKSNKEIAQDLFITSHTVKAHVSNIIQKLSAKDRTDASVRAFRQGLFH
ncbi:MAG: response regulator transcription factor [Cyanobacteria bacterium REEB446]|nr:response regulator transcription factor [Cyanobacteria bacterium REEB446]